MSALHKPIDHGTARGQHPRVMSFGSRFGFAWAFAARAMPAAENDAS